MRAINHALAGAVIGLFVGPPLLALPLAFVSHIVLDALPHFGINGDQDIAKPWFKPLLFADALACVLLVALLAVSRPEHWLDAALCAFAATALDLMWLPKFIKSLPSGRIISNKHWWEKLHSEQGLQWFQRPIGAVVEVVWLVAGVVVMASFIG